MTLPLRFGERCLLAQRRRNAHKLFRFVQRILGYDDLASRRTHRCDQQKRIAEPVELRR